MRIKHIHNISQSFQEINLKGNINITLSENVRYYVHYNKKNQAIVIQTYVADDFKHSDLKIKQIVVSNPSAHIQIQEHFVIIPNFVLKPL